MSHRKITAVDCTVCGDKGHEIRTSYYHGYFPPLIIQSLHIIYHNLYFPHRAWDVAQWRKCNHWHRCLNADYKVSIIHISSLFSVVLKSEEMDFISRYWTQDTCDSCGFKVNLTYHMCCTWCYMFTCSISYDLRKVTMWPMTTTLELLSLNLHRCWNMLIFFLCVSLTCF